MAYAYRIYDQQAVYFLTCTVVQWVDVFSRRDYADIIVNSLKYCQQHKGLEIFGWVIMTNHLHIIAATRDGFELSDTLRDFKKYTATQVVHAIETNKQESRKSWLLWLFRNDKGVSFWQPDNHAEEIHSSDFFRQKLNYIHMNPVNAGITDMEEAYIYSSARDFNGRKGLIELSYFD